MPILGIFSPKTILMFRVGLKKNRVGRQQEPHIFHLSLMPLTICILVDFPIHIDTISMTLPIVYLKGSQIEFS